MAAVLSPFVGPPRFRAGHASRVHLVAVVEAMRAVDLIKNLLLSFGGVIESPKLCAEASVHGLGHRSHVGHDIVEGDDQGRAGEVGDTVVIVDVFIEYLRWPGVGAGDQVRGQAVKRRSNDDHQRLTEPCRPFQLGNVMHMRGHRHASICVLEGEDRKRVARPRKPFHYQLCGGIDSSSHPLGSEPEQDR